MSKHIELIKKLNELAKRGEGGEKENAEKILNKMLADHGLTLEDIEGEQKKKHAVKLMKKDRVFYYQVMGKVLGDIPVYKSRVAGYVVYECSDSDFMLMTAYYKFYKNQLDIEQKRMYKAFIMKHDIYDKSKEAREATDEEMAELAKLRKMAQGMQDVSISKLIN